MPDTRSGSIEVLHLSKQFLQRETGLTLDVLNDISFCAEPGTFLALVGESGCGKTTLLSLAAGLLKPTKGEVKNSGVSFGYMLQKDELFPWRTIEKNIFLPLEIQKTDTAQHRARALALAEKYGLKDFLKSYPSQLSGGMRQRAALIRTLAVDPDVLLLDEPFSALDYQTDAALRQAVARQTHDATVLIVAQRLSTILHADQILVLDGGRIVGCGTHAALLRGCETYREIALSQLSAAELGQEG